MTVDYLSPLVDRWSEAEAAPLSDLELLIYQSRLIGSEPRLVLWGGGNTSLKTREVDYRGRSCAVLRIKGSGSDLKSVSARDFPAVRLEDVLALFEREEMSEEEMVTYLQHALLDPQAPRPSIETLLHAFIPARSVVHSHADAILALTNNTRSEELLRTIYGDEIAVLPYMRPGFRLSKLVGETVRARPGLTALVLLNHGLITWDDDAATAYRRHLALVNRALRFIAESAPQRVVTGVASSGAAVGREERRARAAALAPLVRGLLSREERVIVRFDDGEEVLRFVTGERLPLERLRAGIEAGAATPDHMLSIKRKALWVQLEDGDQANAESLAVATRAALERYIADYHEYYQRYQQGEPMLTPIPRVMLIAGLGMFVAGKDAQAVTVASDVARHMLTIIEAAERVGSYRSLGERETFAAEYWPRELYKLTLAPPEKALSRRVALVTGAAGAIGSAIAQRFAAEGAHVVCADINLSKAEELVAELAAHWPHQRGLALEMDVTDEESVAAAYRRILLEYGGLDILVSNAGIAHSCPLDALSLADWQRSLAVNATGHFLVAREALRIMKAQGMGGSIIFIATKNVTAPGKDFGAYSASKAAQAQLARVLALEGGPFGIRSNIINPDAIFAGSGLWSPEVRAERARSHGIDPSQLEEFYRQRNILRRQVTAADVAEAALFYASDRSAATTGSMLPVDGGLREAFPR
jgi:rhamnulose-1-phosphate aldolase/alcohol dehydrogenase